MVDNRREVIEVMYRDRRLAHGRLFRNRHSDEGAGYHGEMVDEWHSGMRRVCWVVFRGGGKSTIGEEGLVLGACLREFRHGLILAANLDRAVERLHAVRREFERNGELRAIFGDGVGRPWGDDLIELSWGVTIRAMGRGQALRGTKDEATRPDLIFADDIEDVESLRTEQGRRKVQDWFLLEVLPAADPRARVRLAANMLGPECLAAKLRSVGERAQGRGELGGWRVRVVPWEYRDEEGNRVASWPARFPLRHIDEIEQMYVGLGNLRGYRQEYMCEAQAPEAQLFRNDMRVVEPRVRTWEAVSVMIDPARTIGADASNTGFAAWSWVGARLIVWECWSRKLMPDEIVDLVFEKDAFYRPIQLGIEEDGLEEWLRQPLRERMRQRGIFPPVRGIRAPKGKLDFIRALQPWFMAREVRFAQDTHSDGPCAGWMEFLGFPLGIIDAPNALAYCLHPRLKAGLPIYEDFSAQHVSPELILEDDEAFLGLNADGTHVTGVLVQFPARGESGEHVLVHRDWVLEGEPATEVTELVQQASRAARRQVRTVIPREDKYTSSGLAPVLRKLGIRYEVGGALEDGRAELRHLLATQHKGFPSFRISASARTVLNGFAGGYCRPELKSGLLAPEPEPGQYRCVMEGLEALAATLRVGDQAVFQGNATSRTGQTYFSARPRPEVS